MHPAKPVSARQYEYPKQCLMNLTDPTTVIPDSKGERLVCARDLPVLVCLYSERFLEIHLSATERKKRSPCCYLFGQCFVEKDEECKVCVVISLNFKPIATVSRMGLMESRLSHRCRWCGGPPPPKVKCDEAGSLMESYLCHRGDLPPGGPPPPLPGMRT